MAVQKLGDVAVGTIVKLNESGSPVEYRIVQQGKPSSGNYDDSCNGTWVRRKDIHSNRQWHTGNVNDYANSSNHQWLNNESSGFLSLLDPDIRAAIKTVKIPYRPGSGSGYSVSSGANGLSCKVFLLSMKEVGLTPNRSPTEGATLEYFSGGGNSQRVANLNGSPARWWSRSPDCDYYVSSAYSVEADGTADYSYCSNSYGCCPAFILDSELLVSDDGTVLTNEPPTAPGSIAVTGVVGGGSATITLTAATDPDGTVESYRYERQVDGGSWTQFADVDSLTQTDAVSSDWGTVAYRACAVDNGGVSGPYVTSSTETVNDGWVTIGGPAESMGSKPAPFDFAFSVSVSGQSSTGAITVSAALDGKQVYSGTPNAETQISVPIDTRLLGAGEHAIEVQASKDDYLPASKRYTFTVPAVTIPAGGTGEQAQGSDGRPVFHTTLAQRCIGTDGVDIQAQVDALTARVKTLEG